MRAPCHDAGSESEQAGAGVALIYFSFFSLGCLPLQDNQTPQHKSDWQFITAAMFLSRCAT